MLKGFTVSNPKVHEILNTAFICDAFGCTPSKLRMEDPDELRRVGYAIKALKIASDPLVRMFGSGK